MGSSASNVKEGAPVNPRLLYTENLSKNNNKPLVLDTPVLIDVDHGSIRYRYGPYKDEPVDKRKRVERPYGGSETVDKKHYFYHARVKKDGEEDFKRVYVAKGPTRSKDKFIYYVYGKGGFEGQDGDKVYPSQNKLEDKDYAWPANRNFNDLYYEVSFPLQGI
ncbi:hypothetical protein LOTGIDRAFT_162477 [Lottia gigantea]|uniref:Uncharacterized protein n=1 Tax=Lottia gigantea TaxID=225164 RepID=V4BU67_LOTGI|nr:hypothetical protein LOTGIDRAFT_162477 [Lottia gigantea]ESO92569.1 hypothetical protein LOTGIDRAFT_162477 [Lottia gigantea]